MKARLERAVSWVALVTVMLTLFCLWFFLLRSDPPAHGQELLRPCREGVERAEQASAQVIAFSCGSGAKLRLPLALETASTMQRKGLKLLRLEPLRERFAIRISRSGPEWKSDAVPGWPGAIGVAVSSGSETRFRLQSGIVDLALSDAAPKTPERTRRILAEALALLLPGNRQARFAFPVKEAALRAARRIDLQSYPADLCRAGRCRLP